MRVLSDNGRLPDGLDPNIVYFVITNANATSGLTTTKDIKLAKTETDAKNASGLTINNLGGSLKIVSRVSDKNSGDIGHPIQYSTTENQWYINVSTASTERALYDDVVVGLGTTAIGESTPRSFIKRKSDTRALMIRSIDLDMLFLHQVVVQMLDLQVMDLFYKNQIPQSDQLILRFKHTLVLEL